MYAPKRLDTCMVLYNRHNQNRAVPALWNILSCFSLCSKAYSPRQPLENNGLFTIPVDLPFPRCHTSVSMHHLTSGSWLLSLGIISLRFIHVVAFWYHSILWLCLFILHSPHERHLGCFQFLVSVNKASINIYVKNN